MLIDWGRIQSFANEDDPDDLQWLLEMVSTLISNTDERLKELDSFMEKKDKANIQSMLHQLKGVTANFGLSKMNDICVNAESHIKQGNLDSSIEESKLLRNVWNETKVELQRKYKLS